MVEHRSAFEHENIPTIDTTVAEEHVDGLAQDCSNSISNALELLQFCSKPSMLSSQLASLRVHVPSRVDTQDREYKNEFALVIFKSFNNNCWNIVMASIEYVCTIYDISIHLSMFFAISTV